MKISFLLQFGNIFGADVAHTASKSPDLFENDAGNISLIGNDAFYSFRNQFIELCSSLAIALASGLARLHGTERAHAAVDFHPTAGDIADVSRSFSGAGQSSPEHDRTCSESEGYSDVSGILDAAVGANRNIGLSQGFGAIVNGCHLRAADAGNDASGANGSRPLTDFHSVSARIGQSPGRFGLRDVSGHDIDFRKLPFQLL